MEGGREEGRKGERERQRVTRQRDRERVRVRERAVLPTPRLAFAWWNSNFCLIMVSFTVFFFYTFCNILHIRSKSRGFWHCTGDQLCAYN